LGASAKIGEVGWKNLCRPTIFFATVLFRVQALRNVICSLSARFSDSFTVVLDDLLLIRVNWKVCWF
jgi:hypothetical protein